MLIDCDRLPLFTAAGDDKLELSLISCCAAACSDACDDVAAAAIFVCGTLLSATPGCEHIAHALALRSPLLGPSSCGLRVALQQPRLAAHVSLARCMSAAAALAPAVPAVTSRFLRLSSACASASVLPLSAAINGVACVCVAQPPTTIHCIAHASLQVPAARPRRQRIRLSAVDAALPHRSCCSFNRGPPAAAAARA